MAIFILVMDCSVPGGEVTIHKVEEVKFKEFYDNDLSAYVDGEFDNDKNWMQVDKKTKFLVDRNFTLRADPIGEEEPRCARCYGPRGKNIQFCDECNSELVVIQSDEAKSKQLVRQKAWAEDVIMNPDGEDDIMPDEDEDQGLKTYVVDFELAGDVEVQAKDEEEARMKASEVPIGKLVFQNTHYGEQYVDEVKTVHWLKK